MIWYSYSNRATKKIFLSRVIERLLIKLCNISLNISFGILYRLYVIVWERSRNPKGFEKFYAKNALCNIYSKFTIISSQTNGNKGGTFYNGPYIYILLEEVSSVLTWKITIILERLCQKLLFTSKKLYKSWNAR